MALPQKGKMLWCPYFRSFIKLTNFSRTGNFIEKLNFVSTPWKIKIPPQPHHQPHPSIHPTHHTPPHPPHPTTTPTPPPPTHPWRKSGALMPDISWAPPHSLPGGWRVGGCTTVYFCVPNSGRGMAVGRLCRNWGVYLFGRHATV